MLTEIKYGLSTKKVKDAIAKQKRKEATAIMPSGSLSGFFRLRIEKQRVIVVPHYGFAHGIEMDAEPELIAVILDYSEKKKKAYEAEFEKIGGENSDRAENAAD